MSIEAVIFDLDNTLCQYDISTFEVLKKVLEHMGEISIWYDHPEIFNETHWKDSLDALWKESHDQLQDGNLESRFTYGANLANALHLLRQAGIEDDTFLEDVEQRCLNMTRDHLIFLPGAPEVVQALSENYKIGLITNGPTELQWGKINHLGIKDWFGAIVVSHDIGVLKPDSRIFEAALKELEIAPDHALYVGDSLKHDIQGARNAGLKSVWVNPQGFALGEDDPKPDVEIKELDELLEWVKGLSPVD